MKKESVWFNVAVKGGYDIGPIFDRYEEAFEAMIALIKAGTKGLEVRRYAKEIGYVV